jgi:hypothetical protein
MSTSSESALEDVLDLGDGLHFCFYCLPLLSWIIVIWFGGRSLGLESLFLVLVNAFPNLRLKCLEIKGTFAFVSLHELQQIFNGFEVFLIKVVFLSKVAFIVSAKALIDIAWIPLLHRYCYRLQWCCKHKSVTLLISLRILSHISWQMIG